MAAGNISCRFQSVFPDWYRPILHLRSTARTSRLADNSGPGQHADHSASLYGNLYSRGSVFPAGWRSFDDSRRFSIWIGAGHYVRDHLRNNRRHGPVSRRKNHDQRCLEIADGALA